MRRMILALATRRARAISQTELRQPTVVVAPHQDDEVLGCGGTICLMRDLGTPVDIVFLTDGSGSHKKFCSANDMAALRQDEARNAARILGVDAAKVHFLDIPSQKLTESSDRATADLSVLLGSSGADRFMIPHRFESHPDHVAAHRICRRAISSLGRTAVVLEYPVWFWDHYPWLAQPVFSPRHLGGRVKHSLKSLALLLGEFNGKVDIASVLERKRAALEAHVSQVAGLGDDEDWPVLDDVSDGDFSACFARPYELFVAAQVDPESGQRPT